MSQSYPIINSQSDLDLIRESLIAYLDDDDEYNEDIHLLLKKLPITI